MRAIGADAVVDIAESATSVRAASSESGRSSIEGSGEQRGPRLRSLVGAGAR